MRTLKDQAIFLAQFMDDKAPFNSFKSVVKWAAKKGFKGIQIPSWDQRCFDLEKAAESKTYCDDLVGYAAQYDIKLTDLSTHLQGQLIAVHPAYDTMFDAFAPDKVKGKPQARTDWAIKQLLNAAKASKHFGFKSMATFFWQFALAYGLSLASKTARIGRVRV